MPAIQKLSGAWRGRLVDIQGFEGELHLTLKSDDNGELRGTFTVQVGTHHSSMRQEGEVHGKGSEKTLTLALAPEPRRRPVKINLTADVLALRDGGTALRGIYEVSARGYSPLRGGVVCASTHRKDDDEVVTATRQTREHP